MNSTSPTSSCAPGILRVGWTPVKETVVDHSHWRWCTNNCTNKYVHKQILLLILYSIMITTMFLVQYFSNLSNSVFPCYQGADGRWELVGITSWGIGCGEGWDDYYYDCWLNLTLIYLKLFQASARSIHSGHWVFIMDTTSDWLQIRCEKWE